MEFLGKWKGVLVLMLICTQAMLGQYEGIEFFDNTYVNNLKTVRFSIQSSEMLMPIVDVKAAPGTLKLQFDDLDADIKNYTYTIIHCDADWKPSAMAELEYMASFSEERIRDPEFSQNTIVQYTHYETTLPNDNIGWTKSGNYLLVVYEDDDERQVVITRRFMVVENTVVMVPAIQRPMKVERIRSHQEMDFTVNHKGFRINNPKSEIRACILQNGRWDNAIMNVPPAFFRPDELLFDYQDSLVFAAGQEFRWADLRTTQYVSRRVREIYREDGQWYLLLAPDADRYGQSYAFVKDLNGQYVIQNLQGITPTTDADYINAVFSLECPEKVVGGDVYIVGAFSEWQCKPEFKMTYDSEHARYLLSALLKQGFYDYQYRVQPQRGYETAKTFEYDWHETENEYTILLYYRPFGLHYDRLIAVNTLSSFKK